MGTLAILAQFEARPGKEAEVEQFLRAALPLAQAEPATTAWFGLRLGPRTFGIFDVFPNEPARQAHLSGRIAQQLMAKAPELFTGPPNIQMLDIVAAKLS
ncbi:MAG TPA: antibiotic biosynthesis monooxygenase [Acidobacteriaceae bacterium]|jgi:quinol monooxygenase YgiN